MKSYHRGPGQGHWQPLRVGRPLCTCASCLCVCVCGVCVWCVSRPWESRAVSPSTDNYSQARRARTRGRDCASSAGEGLDRCPITMDVTAHWSVTVRDMTKSRQGRDSAFSGASRHGRDRALVQGRDRARSLAALRVLGATIETRMAPRTVKADASDRTGPTRTWSRTAGGRTRTIRGQIHGGGT